MTFQIPNANSCYALFGLREGLGTIGNQHIHGRFVTHISAIGLGRSAPDPEEAHSDISESADPEPHQRYRYQHGDCPLLVL